jgi:hypothetical protein
MTCPTYRSVSSDGALMSAAKVRSLSQWLIHLASHYNNCRTPVSCRPQVPLTHVCSQPVQPHKREDTMDDDEYSDCESQSSVVVFSTHEQSATTATSVSDNESNTASMRSSSPAPSLMSMSSVLREALYRQEFGRDVNNYSNVYQLPADEEELDRLGEFSPRLSNSLIFMLSRATI